MNISTTSLVLAALVIASGCNGSAGGSATGTVQLAAAAETTDSPTNTEPLPEGLAHLDLSVKTIDVHVASEADVEAGDTNGEPGDDAGAGWITIASDQDIVLRPGGNQIALGAAAVPAGKLTQVRLVLDDDAVLWTGTGSIEVACPSCRTSGLKLVVDGDMQVPAGGEVALTLMFDLTQTALLATSGSKLGPVIHVEASAEASP